MRCGLPELETRTTVTRALASTVSPLRTSWSSTSDAPPMVRAARDHFEHVVEAPGLQIIDLDAPDHEHRRLAVFGIGEALMMDAEQPDEIGTAALAEFQKVGVIDEAGEIGVLEIDADRKDVNFAVDAPGKIRPLD